MLGEGASVGSTSAAQNLLEYMSLKALCEGRRLLAAATTAICRLQRFREGNTLLLAGSGFEEQKVVSTASCFANPDSRNLTGFKCPGAAFATGFCVPPPC